MSNRQELKRQSIIRTQNPFASSPPPSLPLLGPLGQLPTLTPQSDLSGHCFPSSHCFLIHGRPQPGSLCRTFLTDLPVSNSSHSFIILTPKLGSIHCCLVLQWLLSPPTSQARHSTAYSLTRVSFDSVLLQPHRLLSSLSTTLATLFRFVLLHYPHLPSLYLAQSKQTPSWGT